MLTAMKLVTILATFSFNVSALTIPKNATMEIDTDDAGTDDGPDDGYTFDLTAFREHIAAEVASSKTNASGIDTFGNGSFFFEKNGVRRDPPEFNHLSNPACVKKALAARAIWRYMCKWDRTLALTFCWRHAPAPDRCCIKHPYHTCHIIWEEKWGYGFGPGDCDNWSARSTPRKDWGLNDKICSCMWKKHCGNW